MSINRLRFEILLKISIALFRKPAATVHTSSLRIEPMGPNPDLCKGPDPSLLLKTYAQRMGPNRANRKGPMVRNNFSEKQNHLLYSLNYAKRVSSCHGESPHNFPKQHSLFR